MGSSESNVWVPIGSLKGAPVFFSDDSAQLFLGCIYRSLMKPSESWCQGWSAPDWSSLLGRRGRPPAGCDSFPVLKAALWGLGLLAGGCGCISFFLKLFFHSDPFFFFFFL